MLSLHTKIRTVPEHALHALGPMNGATLTDDEIDRERTRYRGAVYLPAMSTRTHGRYRPSSGNSTAGGID
jgi:hypothetical protein